MEEKSTNLSVLIVEDDGILRRSIKRALKSWSNNIQEASNLFEANQALDSKPDLIILDIHLPDGNGVSFAETIAKIRPLPLVIAISGLASAEQAFKLRELGVRGYLQKPFSLNDLQQTLESLLKTAPDLSTHLSASVGKVSIKEASSEVRKSMLIQALGLTKGNISKAAKLLKVTRQAIQQMINEYKINIKNYK